MSEMTCEACGAVFEVTKTSIPFRDKDSLDCDDCGKELIRWNGGVMYTSVLIRHGTRPPAPTPGTKP